MSLSESMYAEFIKEREGLDLIETNAGFLTFKIVGGECFIANMFIRPSERGSQLCEELLSNLFDYAMTRKCEVVTGNIHLNDKGCNRTLRAALKNGFNLVKAEHGVLLIAKRMGE